MHIDNDPVINAPPLHIKGMGALDLITCPYAAGTAYAPVMVQTVSFMGKIYRRQIRASIFKTRVIHTKLGAPGPQLATAVRNTNRADVIALGKQSSRTILRYSFSFSVWVRTFIPSWASVTHAGMSLLAPSTSTRQSLQAPIGVKPSR